MVCLGRWWRASPKPQGPRSLEFSFIIPALSRTDPGRRDWARRERKSGLSPPPWEQRRREINESCHPFPGSTRAEQFPPRWEDQPLFMSPSEGGTVGISIFAPSWGAEELGGRKRPFSEKCRRPSLEARVQPRPEGAASS